MKNQNELRKLLMETRQRKNLSRDKISTLLELKGIKYAESSLLRYETGKTAKIRAEVLKGLSEILDLDIRKLYTLAGFIEEDEDIRIANLNKREKIQLDNVLNSVNYFFNDDNVSDVDKKVLYDVLQELYFDAKLKNKKKK